MTPVLSQSACAADVDECEMNPNLCQNGKCDNTAGSFACRCEDGYSVKTELGPGCTDDDECTIGSFHCDHNADCINIDGMYECRCRDGFTGGNGFTVII